jgi:hypothetical protein
MELTAEVWDGVTGDGIPSASVMFVDPNGSLKSSGVIADGNGRFHVNSPLLDQGYKLQITSTGYKGVIVPAYILQESGGISLDRGGALEPVVITAKKKIPTAWLIAGIGLLLLLLYAAEKNGKVGALSSKEWTDIALKVGITAGVFFLVLVPLLKKIGLWGGPAAGKDDQTTANAKAVDDSLNQVKQQGGQQSVVTKTDAELQGMANQIYDIGGGDDPEGQQKIRNIIIQSNTLADVLSLVKAFGTRKVGGGFLSLCGFFSINCPTMDFNTFVKAVAPAQLDTINNYFSATGINYRI